jgi:beta-glucanase (GH16 family)
MTLVWQDDFEANDINADNWSFEIGDGCPNLCGWGNAELQYYTDDNASIVEGHLVIEAKKENRGSRSYTSSRMISKNKQSFQYGRIDIRANLPYGQGIWPALWMLGDNINQVGWPACGEIDIMELIGGDASGRDNTIHGTAHWQDDGFKADYGSAYSLSDGIFNDEFHVFSLVWTENQIQWLVDDHIFHQMAITDPLLSEFRKSFFFIFNIAVGGSWPGSPTISTVFPQYMIVDYIRVFQAE